jgi:uncharacterized protein YoxC
MNDDIEKSKKSTDKENDNPEESQPQEIENDKPGEVLPPEHEKDNDIEESVEEEVVEEPGEEPSTTQTEEELAAELIEQEAIAEPGVESHEGDDISMLPEEAESADQDTTTIDEVTISEVEPPLPAPPSFTTWGQALLMSFGCSSLALILALVIGFAVLAGLNSGNLLFATPAQVSKLALEVERIDKEVKGIEQDLDGLQSRVDNLEGLSGRMDEVEETAKVLVTQVTSITSQVEEMDQKVQDLTTDVETLQAESSRYQDFFNGLRELLGKVLTTEEGSNEQQPK